MGQSLLRVEFYQYQNLQFGLGCGNRNISFDALRVALNLGGQATAGGALQLPVPSL